ncbi:hypothetical protein AGMMS50276_06440 [Synergistales bacterium]|nr:hypothetical protein AGMMS50276_06440 [Synergistales bacterium]
MKKQNFVYLALAAVFFALFAPPAHSATKPDWVEEVPGLRFENMQYDWDSLHIDIVNMTSGNKFFGGTVIFLDRFGHSVAYAHLLPQKVPGNRTKRFTGYFISGTGETARRAARVLWDFGPR